jgi:hypothetical protein
MRAHAESQSARVAPRAAVALTLAALFAGSTVHAQHVEDFGAYRVRCNALPSAQLLPSMAQAYGIVRSPERGIVNISVQRTAGGVASDPIRAAVTGTAASLGGERVPLRFREIVEDGAVGYISEFPVGAPDTIRFSITVTPESATSPHTLTFQQDFVPD